MAAMSYVTGSHNIKVGFQDRSGRIRRYNNANADLYQTYNNGAPLQRHGAEHAAARSSEDLDANLGIYAPGLVAPRTS